MRDGLSFNIFTHYVAIYGEDRAKSILAVFSIYSGLNGRWYFYELREAKSNKEVVE